MSQTATTFRTADRNSMLYLQSAWATSTAVMATACVAWLLLVAVIALQTVLALRPPSPDAEFDRVVAPVFFNGLLTLSLGLKLRRLAWSRRFRSTPAYPYNIVFALPILFGVFYALPGLMFLLKGPLAYIEHLLISGLGFIFFLSLLFGEHPWRRGLLIYLAVCAVFVGLGQTEFANDLWMYQDGGRYLRMLSFFGFLLATTYFVDAGCRACMPGQVDGTPRTGARWKSPFGFHLSPKTFQDGSAQKESLWRWYPYGLMDLDIVGRIVAVFSTILVGFALLGTTRSSDQPIFLYGVGVFVLSAFVIKLLGMLSLLDTGRLRRMYLQSEVPSLEAFLRQITKFRYYSAVVIFSIYTIGVWLFGIAMGIDAWFLPPLFIIGSCLSLAVMTWIAIINPLHRVFVQALSVAAIWLSLLVAIIFIDYWQLWYGGALQYVLLALLTAVCMVGLYKAWIVWGRQDVELTSSGPWIVRVIIRSM